MKYAHSEYEVELINEMYYTKNSADNLNDYKAIINASDGGTHPSSKIGVLITKDGKLISSALIMAGGGFSGTNDWSVAMVADKMIMAIGNMIMAMSIPELDVKWQIKADDATCFAVYNIQNHQRLVVHGEIQISCVDYCGNMIWQRSGRDIFSGSCSIRGNVIVVEDFNNKVYKFAVSDGKECS
jgi:hypothetical protein